MKEWFVQNFDAVSICGILTAAGSLAAAITSLIRSWKLGQALKKAKESKYWTTCPRCKRRIYLDELTLHMPDGAVDNDLNGKPDDAE